MDHQTALLMVAVVQVLVNPSGKTRHVLFAWRRRTTQSCSIAALTREGAGRTYATQAIGIRIVWISTVKLKHLAIKVVPMGKEGLRMVGIWHHRAFRALVTTTRKKSRTMKRSYHGAIGGGFLVMLRISHQAIGGGFLVMLTFYHQVLPVLSAVAECKDGER
jgi:hypothetical protein